MDTRIVLSEIGHYNPQRDMAFRPENPRLA